MCVDHIGSPLSNAKRKIEHIYSGPMESDLVDMMVQCDPDVSTTAIWSHCGVVDKPIGPAKQNFVVKLGLFSYPSV